MSTDRPPLTRPTMVPSTSSSRSQAAEISSQMRILSAFSLERTTMPVSFSRLSRDFDGVARLDGDLAVEGS